MHIELLNTTHLWIVQKQCTMNQYVLQYIHTITYTSIHLHTYIHTYVVCTGSIVIHTCTCIEFIHVHEYTSGLLHMPHTPQQLCEASSPPSFRLPACLTFCLHSAFCSPPGSAPVDRAPPCGWLCSPSRHSSLSWVHRGPSDDVLAQLSWCFVCLFACKHSNMALTINLLTFRCPNTHKHTPLLLFHFSNFLLQCSLFSLHSNPAPSTLLAVVLWKHTHTEREKYSRKCVQY